MLTKEEEITVNSYDRLAHPWAVNHQDTDVFNGAFPIFQRYCLLNGSILDIGCGGGRDTVKIANAGYQVTGVDRSFGLLQEAKHNFPDLKFVQQDIYNLSFQEPFDGFWCAATLIHLPKERISEALQSIHHVIRPNGVGFICIKKGESDMVLEREELDGQVFERYFSYYQEGEFSQILEANNFPIIHGYPQYVSEKTTWLNFIVRTGK